MSLAGLLCPYFLIRCFTLLRHTEFAKLGCLMVESSGASEDSLDITTVGDREGYFDNLRGIYHQSTLVMTFRVFKQPSLPMTTVLSRPSLMQVSEHAIYCHHGSNHILN